MSRTVRMSGGALGGEFTPLRHGSNLKLWRKADAGLTLDVSPDILSWADQVAGGDAATVPGIHKPHIEVASQNGLDAITFSTEQQRALRANDNAIDNFWSGAGSKMIVCGFRFDDTASTVRLLEKGHSNGAGWFLRAENGSASGPARLVLATRFSGDDFFCRTTDAVTHATHLAVLVWDGDDSDPDHFRIDGASLFDDRGTPTGSLDDDSSHGLTTGNSDVLTSNLRGAIFEYYLVKPAPASVTPDETYMNAKWDLF